MYNYQVINNYQVKYILDFETLLTIFKLNVQFQVKYIFSYFQFKLQTNFLFLMYFQFLYQLFMCMIVGISYIFIYSTIIMNYNLFNNQI